MPDLLIRGLDEKTVQRLKERAKRHGRSLQSEAKRLLEDAAGREKLEKVLASAEKLRADLGQRFESSADMIREDRDR